MISHKYSGASSHAALRPRDIPVLFHNEYVIRVNQYRRLGIALDSRSAMFSILRNANRSRFTEHILLLLYSFSCAVQFACLLVRRRRKAPKQIFLFTDIRHTRLNAKGYPAFRAGLYNYRYLKIPHLYECLQKRRLITSLLWVMRNFRSVMRSFRNRACALGADPKAYVTCVNAGFWRILDMKIFHAALSQYALQEIAFAGHFDCYAALIGHLRKAGVPFRAVGYQHGLYEAPSNGLRYESLHCDEYALLFKESEKFFQRNLNENSDCIIKIAPLGHQHT
ncbi:MAG: hypothetical protein GF344_12685, partial [Chitinivibrionales bacterium]|nr:hypothetical protein [Chitinivibrionales bacterium]